MGTTVDKLNKLAQTKAAIKAAIEAKGVTVGDAVLVIIQLRLVLLVVVILVELLRIILMNKVLVI